MTLFKMLETKYYRWRMRKKHDPFTTSIDVDVRPYLRMHIDDNLCNIDIEHIRNFEVLKLYIEIMRTKGNLNLLLTDVLQRSSNRPNDAHLLYLIRLLCRFILKEINEDKSK